MSQRESLIVELLSTQRLIESLQGHPYMAKSLRYKEQELKRQIETLRPDKEAKIDLLFSGNPVFGSEGLDISFAGKIVPSFQKMVTSSFNQKNAGQIRKKSKQQKQNMSKLYLTSLPIGSFGLELKKLDNGELFDESLLADTLEEVRDLISVAASTDEKFEEVLPDTPIQTLKNLKEFLKVIYSEKAGVTVETGDKRIELSNEQAKIAFDRVNSTITEETDVFIEGILRGILLDSWRFDFQPNEGKGISGRISDDAPEDELHMYLKEFINKNVQAEFEQSIIVFKDKRPKKIFKLKSIKEIEN